jgi:hypothetical protein
MLQRESSLFCFITLLVSKVYLPSDLFIKINVLKPFKLKMEGVTCGSSSQSSS